MTFDIHPIRQAYFEFLLDEGNCVRIMRTPDSVIDYFFEQTGVEDTQSTRSMLYAFFDEYRSVLPAIKRREDLIKAIEYVERVQPFVTEEDRPRLMYALSTFLSDNGVGIADWVYHNCKPYIERTPYFITIKIFADTIPVRMFVIATDSFLEEYRIERDSLLSYLVTLDGSVTQNMKDVFIESFNFCANHIYTGSHGIGLIHAKTSMTPSRSLIPVDDTTNFVWPTIPFNTRYPTVEHPTLELIKHGYLELRPIKNQG